MTLLVPNTVTPGAVVPSYVRDAWWSPTDDATAQVVLDASTGEPVAKVSSHGLDLASVVDHARTVGQASLGALTFHQRAILLKRLAQYLGGVKEELYALSARTGATRRDSMVDIDGGIGVLFTLSSKARREMPNGHVYVDGEVERLSKDGSFTGEHIYTRIPGVAVPDQRVQLPGLGHAREVRARLHRGRAHHRQAGQPHRLPRRGARAVIIESGILPPGTLQLVSGSARDLIDHLDYRDLVGFTGSAGTARLLKAHPNIVHGGVRFTSETDSLNAAILGPDAVPARRSSTPTSRPSSPR